MTSITNFIKEVSSTVEKAQKTLINPVSQRFEIDLAIKDLQKKLKLFNSDSRCPKLDSQKYKSWKAVLVNSDLAKECQSTVREIDDFFKNLLITVILKDKKRQETLECPSFVLNQNPFFQKLIDLNEGEKGLVIITDTEPTKSLIHFLDTDLISSDIKDFKSVLELAFFADKVKAYKAKEACEAQLIKFIKSRSFNEQHIEILKRFPDLKELSQFIYHIKNKSIQAFLNLLVYSEKTSDKVYHDRFEYEKKLYLSLMKCFKTLNLLNDRELQDLEYLKKEKDLLHTFRRLKSGLKELSKDSISKQLVSTEQASWAVKTIEGMLQPITNNKGQEFIYLTENTYCPSCRLDNHSMEVIYKMFFRTVFDYIMNEIHIINTFGADFEKRSLLLSKQKKTSVDALMVGVAIVRGARNLEEVMKLRNDSVLIQVRHNEMKKFQLSSSESTDDSSEASSESESESEKDLLSSSSEKPSHAATVPNDSRPASEGIQPSLNEGSKLKIKTHADFLHHITWDEYWNDYPWTAKDWKRFKKSTQGLLKDDSRDFAQKVYSRFIDANNRAHIYKEYRYLKTNALEFSATFSKYLSDEQKRYLEVVDNRWKEK